MLLYGDIRIWIDRCIHILCNITCSNGQLYENQPLARIKDREHIVNILWRCPVVKSKRLYQGLAKYGPCVKCGPFPGVGFFFLFVCLFLVTKTLLECGHVHLLSIVYGCFHITTAELGCSSDHMTCKAESVEYLTLC